MNYLLSLLLLLLLFGSAAFADAPKPFIPAEPDIKAFWWPVYIDSEGVKQRRFYGLTQGDYPTAEDGAPLSNIETVIYARALFKPRLSGVGTIEELIEDDQAQFISRDPGIQISEADPIRTLDGHEMKSYTYLPKERGTWERVTYSEEGEFYLLFTIRSQSQQRYQQDMESYLSYIRKYRKSLSNSARQVSSRRELLIKRGEERRNKYRETPSIDQDERRIN